MTSIEAAFAGGLLFNPLQNPTHVDWLESHTAEDFAAFIKGSNDQLAIWVCNELQVGSYYVDFVLGTKCSETGVAVLVGVECDGHDFHEKTKEQAARDKARERFLVREGLTVVRFTGSEIFARPIVCALQAISVLNTRKEAVCDAVRIGGRQ